MEAHAKSLTFIGNEGRIRIPFFQRGYVWEERNWEDLIAELLNFNRNHFLGSLILKQQKPISGEPKEVLVIDGQQRLTTLSILLKAIHDLFSEELQEVTRSTIKTYLFFKKNQTDKNHILKLQHSHIDTLAYKRVIESNDLFYTLDQITDDSSKILRCYKFFVEFLRMVSEDIRKRLFNELLDDNNKILVVIDLAERDNEQAIFDTINSAGVRLSSADIIKNSLFQKALSLFENQDEVIELYESTWKRMFLYDEMTVQFWDSERTTGRLVRDNIEILLHSISVIDGLYDPDKHTLSDLGDLYKAKIEQISDSKEIEDLIQEICDYAGIYREYIATFDATALLSFNDVLRRLLHILDTLQITTFHPFLLFVLKNEVDEISREDIFKRLERFVVRRLITNGDTKGYNKICKEFLTDIGSLAEKAVERSDREVSIGLKKIENKPAALVLFWVELYRRSKDAKFDVKELKYSYSLEHIMPQKWEQYWGNVPQKFKSDGVSISQEEATRDRHEKVYSIGNMTLLTTALNSSLRNFEFSRKVEGEGRKRGIKQYASLSITQDDIVKPYDLGDRIWDEEKIISRTGKLEAEVLAIW
jgi:hypothetical protein